MFGPEWIIIRRKKCVKKFICANQRQKSKVHSLITSCTTIYRGDRGSTVFKVLRYKSEGRWFDPSWCQWIFR